MQFCVNKLASSSNASTPALSVLCGDTNIESYSEIAENFLVNGYIDALVAANPPPLSTAAESDQKSEGRTSTSVSAEQSDLFLHMPTFGQAGLKFIGKVSKERIGRLDYILCRAGSASGLASSSGQSQPSQEANKNSSLDTPPLTIEAQADLVPSGGRGRELKVVRASLLGAEMIPLQVVKKKAGVSDPEMSVFASDHLGVMATTQI